MGLAGRIDIETSLAAETVSPVEPVIEPASAEILVVPLAILVTKPALLMVAMEGFRELHETDAVRSCVLLSLKLPVATNCLVAPTGMLEFAGVITIETRLAPVIVSAALPITDPEAAEMFAVPVATPLVRPNEFTVATLGADDDHVTEVNN